MFWGRWLQYEVVGGMAVHAGDMVLGPAENFRQARRRRAVAKERAIPAGSIPRAVSFNKDRLWPEGVIPYAVDSALSAEQRSRIREAVDHWNDHTVIRLLPRTTESDYVRFQPTEDGRCRANVGRVGGEQGIYIPPDGCSVDAYVHEIGHAVGLWHEHEREDRDRYVMVLDGNLDPAENAGYANVHPADGPYDYASAMHYPLRAYPIGPGPTMETIPPGMSVPSASLSQGDIDGVARLYGKLRFDTVISTNPPGLALVVDGIRQITPLRVNWSDGKIVHTIEAPIEQVAEQTRFLFGRWNIGEQRPGEQRTLSFVGGTLPTWIEANFIVQQPVGIKVTPEGSGRVELQPPSADGYYTDRTPIRAVATPRPGSRYQFWRWRGPLRGNHGRASNPAMWHTDRPDKVFEAEFTTRPIVRIESAIDPFVLYVDDGRKYAPHALLADTGRRVKIGVDATARAVRSRGRQYKFNSWSNGEAIAHFPDLAATQGILKAHLQEQVYLSTPVNDSSAGRVIVQPQSADGFHDKGSLVRLTAAPEPGYEFVRWTGSRNSYEPSISAGMDRPMHIEAEFSQTRELVPGRAQKVTFPSSNARFEVFDRESGYRIEVPEDAVQVNVRFELSTPRSEVELFVHAGSDALRWNYGPDRRTPEFKADFRSVRQGSHESVTISHSSDPPLVPGQPYYVSLVRFGARSRITGSLTAQVQTNPAGIPAAHAAPRAFTFVAPRNARAATQSLRIENQGSGLLRFRIQPNRSWLSVVPSEGVIGPAERQEVSVAADPAGLPSDVYRGTLAVNVTGADEAVPSRDLFLPVSLVVLETQSQAVPAGSRESAGVTQLRLLSRVEPNYTEEARRARLQGTVLLSIEVWEDGRAHNIRVTRGLGLGLDEEAIAAVKQWRFQPGMKDGEPVRVAAQVEVTFRLV